MDYEFHLTPSYIYKNYPHIHASLIRSFIGVRKSNREWFVYFSDELFQRSWEGYFGVYYEKYRKNTDCYYPCYEVGCSWNCWIEKDIAVIEGSRVDIPVYHHMLFQAGITKWSM